MHICMCEKACVCVRVWVHVKEAVCMLECVDVHICMCVSVCSHLFLLECRTLEPEGRNCLAHAVRSVPATGPGAQKSSYLLNKRRTKSLQTSGREPVQDG